jgi:hypothetical protein
MISRTSGTSSAIAPRETSVLDEHYASSPPNRARRAAPPRTQGEADFVALGPVAQALLTLAAGAGASQLAAELADALSLAA